MRENKDFKKDKEIGHTRRNIIKKGGFILGTGTLAGCIGSSPNTQNTNNTNTESSSSSYTVEMAPVGEVKFNSVPETWVANNGSWADMGIALGLEPPKGVWLKNRYHTHYYDEIPGVSVDKSNMVSLYQDGVSKEIFYELDGDVHVIDPNFLMNRFKGWEREDITEIEENVGPFFGNCIYAQHYPWHEDYRYYTLYEGFEKLSKVFKREKYYKKFESVHEDFKANLASVVPGQGERPSVAVLWGVSEKPEKYYPYIIGGGTGFKHLNDLKVRDALASTDIKDFHGSRAAIDLETLLDVDPEVLLLRGYERKSKSEFENTVVEFLKDHETASSLTAVKNDDVYRAGGLYQGPITNLVLTERTAGQLYDFQGNLFDRKKVADIVNGNF